MITKSQFFRDVALELKSCVSDRWTFFPLSVGGFNFACADGALSPLCVGILCDSRIVANPTLLLDSEFIFSLVSDSDYIREAAAWGEVQLSFLSAFVPFQSGKKSENDGKETFKPVFHVRPWQTAIFETFKESKEYFEDIQEEGEFMGEIFQSLISANYGNGEH